MPDNYEEGNRYLYLNTPLGPDKLILLTFNGFESMSELFRFQLEVAAKKDEEIAFDQLIGKAISFGIKGTDDNDPRHFDSICIEFSEGTRDNEFKYYTIVVAPKLWMTTQRRTCRIFQQKSVKDILTTVLAGLDTDLKLQGTYDLREFCVQYNETDFDFASRLMEEEGISYFFKFSEGSHIMVLMDTPQGHEDCPGGSTTYTFDNQGGGNRFEDEERVASWRRMQSWSTAKYTLWDHNFQLTDKHLEAEKTINPETVTAGTKTHKLKLNGNDAFEVFEYPGNYAKRYDGISSSGGDQPGELNQIFSDNSRTVGIRMKQVATPAVLFSGGGNCRRFTAGHKFTLQDHFDADGQYVLTSVTHMATEGDFRSGGDINVEHYENSFTAIPTALAFVPARKTPRPRVFGCQTAKVVGPPGEEIFTDKYGRVKVQFRWDREGQENASSSCWLRVGTPWAGKNWGMIHIPRIGQEVIVDFMDGDPDRPIVIGSVYNPDQMPPYPLPDNKTQSGLQTRSSKGGGPANCNEIKFEDLKGSEKLWIHAEKDMDTHVEHDDAQWIEHDQTIKVDNDRTEIVGGSEKINVKGDRHNKLDGNHYEQVASDLSLKIGGNQNVKVGANAGLDAGQSISLKGGLNIVLEAGMGITLKGSGGFITIDPSGVTISGILVKINSGGAAIPGVPVVVVPPQITPPTPPIEPIPGTSSNASGPSGPVTMAAIPSIQPLPPLPSVAVVVSQVSALLNGAVDGAAQSLSSLNSSLNQQINAVAASTGQVEDELKTAIANAENHVQSAIDDAKKDVQSAVDEVKQEAQQELKQVANQVAELENQAAQNLQNLQQQSQQLANQAEQMAQQAMQEGKSALAEAAQQAQNAAHQAQQLANQAEQQVQQVASQAEQIAKDAESQGQQALSAASQQLSTLTDEAKQGVQQVQQQAQAAAQQSQAMAQEAMAQGEQAVSQAAQQAQQAAQQAQQQAQQAASQAQQAAQEAKQQAEKQADQAVAGIQKAANQAAKEVSQAAQEGNQMINNAANQATQQGQQVAKSAEQAAGQIGQTADQAFGQVGKTAADAVKGAQNALGGLRN